MNCKDKTFSPSVQRFYDESRHNVDVRGHVAALSEQKRNILAPTTNGQRSRNCHL